MRKQIAEMTKALSARVQTYVFSLAVVALALFSTGVALPASATAASSTNFFTRICTRGAGAGQCNFTTGIVTNPVTGNVYVLDRGNERVDVFSPWGTFLKAFGGGVVKAGFPGNVPTNELQNIVVSATGGTFNLMFRAPNGVEETTSENLPYNATAAQVQAALEDLPIVGVGNITVSSSNAGGQSGVPGGPYTVEFKGNYADTDVAGLQARAGSPSLSNGSIEIEPLRQGASAPEVCTGEDCRSGVDGIRAGQFASPHGLAVDAEGNLYVYEAADCVGGEGCLEAFSYINHGTYRVQKFDAEGNFLLMFGRGVDEGGGTPSNPGDICTAQDLANGDVCGGGIRGSGDGQFGLGGLSGGTEPGGDRIAVGPGGTVFVGGSGRIQKFDLSGNFKGLVPDPGGVLTGQAIQSLAVDPVSGSLFVTFYGSSEDRGSMNDIRKLNSSTGELLGVLKAIKPSGLALDSSGNLFAFEETFITSNPADPANHLARIVGFDSSGQQSTLFGEGDFSHETFADPVGMATSSACGIPGAELFVGDDANERFIVRAYGPPPDPAVCPPPPRAPEIASQFLVAAETTGATLRATINPHFWPDTSYYVEYGTGKCSEGGCTQRLPEAGERRLSSATTNDPVTTSGVFLAGLNPATTYHYRFVAQSSGGGPVRGVGGEVGSDGAEGTFTTLPNGAPGKTDCPNQAFRAGSAGALPDCRAYEMVSPVDKNGGDAIAPEGYAGGLYVGAASGERMTYSSSRSFGDPQAAPLFSQYMSSRGSSGWKTEPISPPRSNFPLYNAGGAGQFKSFSEDLCSAWILQDSTYSLAPESPTNAANLYRRENCGEDDYELLTTVPAPGFDFQKEIEQVGEVVESTYYPNPQGHSLDGTRTVFRSDGKLTSNACGDGTGQTTFQLYESSQDGPLRLVSVLPRGKADCLDTSVGMFNGVPDNFTKSHLYRGVSADGSRVFWTASDGGVTQLYARLNATQAQSKVSGGKCTEAEKACTIEIASGGFFWEADPQGEHVLYTVGEKLFEFDVEDEQSHLLAEGVKGVAGMSEDASRIYLASTAVLSGEQQNSQGDRAEKGSLNLYLYEAGEGGVSFTFIAALAGADAETDLAAFKPSVIATNPERKASRMTPEGLHLAFMSSAPLTGYDNTDQNVGKADAEVYIYDASPGAAGELHCVSCNPTAARPIGRNIGSTEPQSQYWAASRLPGWPGQLNPSRLLSTSGGRLFFESFEPLVLGDTNGRTDVYEWERSTDAGGCEELGAQLHVASSGGCISLITSGNSPVDSKLLDASADGRDVFFATSSSLLPQDPGLVDVYDARAGGGFPQPPVPTAACEGEACQGPLAPPNDPTPGSSSFQGAGNVVEAKAKKKHTKKKHAKKRKANKKRGAGR